MLELDKYISELYKLQAKVQTSGTKRMARPSRTGTSQTATMIEAIADTCEQIELTQEALFNVTIQFLINAKTAISDADAETKRRIQ